MVEKIAGCYWRLRRVMRAEVGEIQKRLDFSVHREGARWVDALRSSGSGAIGEAGTAAPLLDVAARELAALDDIRGCMQHDGRLRPEDADRIAKAALQLRSPGLVLNLLKRLSPDDSADPHAGDPATVAQPREQMLKLIDSYRRLQNLIVEAAAERSTEEFAATLNAAVARYHMPDRGASMRLRLYEAAISRELYHAMRELKRLQLDRIGQPSRRSRKIGAAAQK